MRLVPYERFVLRTASAPEEVAARLSLVPARELGGETRGGRFVVTLRLPSQQAHLPVAVIVGEIVAVPDGSEVRIAMRPDTFSVVTTLLLCGLLLVSIVFTILGGLRTGFTNSGAMLGLAVMVPLLFAVWGFVNARFWKEASQARRMLQATAAPPVGA